MTHEERPWALPVGVQDIAPKQRKPLRWTNLPWHAMEIVCAVFDAGEVEHARRSWKAGYPERFRLDSAMRHLVAHLCGRVADPDTQQAALAHTIAQLLILLENLADGTAGEREVK